MPMTIENRRPKRIVRILNRFNVGGPIWNVAYLTKYLPATYETLLVGGKATDTEADAQEILNLLNIEFQLIPSMSREINVFHDLRSLYKLWKMMRKFKPDLVHTHASKAGLLGRIAAIIAGVPVIVHTYHGHVFEGYFNHTKSSLIQQIERFLAKRTAAIVAISEIQKIALTEKFKICTPDKAHIIPLGFDLRPFYPNHDKRQQARKKYKLESGTIAVGIVGRLTTIKNHGLFLRAASLLGKKTPNKYVFFVVGDGDKKEELVNITRELEIYESVHFTSWIYAMETFYPAMDLICLTSFNEGTPVSLIEAQAAGIPVISTQVGGVENTLVSGSTGLLLSSFDPAELAEKIEHLAEDEPYRMQMSKNAHTFAVERFSYQRLVAATEQLYERLLKNAL